MSTPTPTPTVTPTATPPCNRVARVSFVSGSSTTLQNKACCCPNTVKIKCEDLNIDRKYTASIVNLGPANGRIYPRSISFMASSKQRELEFLTQFVCDEDKKTPTYNTVYVSKILVSSDIDIKKLNFKLVNVKWGNSDLDNLLYKIDVIGDKCVIYFDNLVTPSSSKLLNFTILVDGNGIIPSFRQVAVHSTGLINDTMNLVSLNNPPNSISVLKTTILQNSNGSINSTLMNIPPSARKLETASISIDSGTIFYDKDKNPLLGDLNLVVAQFSALETDSLNTFPGGFHITNAVDQQNKPLNNLFYFYSAGFITILVTDSQGNQATSSSKGLTVQTQINNNIVNPNSFDQVKSGDIIPLWIMGYDGIWRQQNGVTLSDNPSTNGFLQTSFVVDRLGFYNLDWSINGCGNLSIDLSEFRIRIPKDKVVYFDMYTEPLASSDSETINTRFKLNPAILKSETFMLINYPDLPIRLTVYNDELRNNKLGELQISRCGVVPEIPLPPPTPSVSVSPSLTPSATPTVTPTITVSPTQTNIPLGASETIV